MTPRTPRLAALALATVAVLPLAACSGGGSDQGEDLTVGRTPAQLLTQSAAAAAKLRTFRVDVTGEATTALTPAAARTLSGPASLLQGRIPFSGAGPVVQPDRFALDISVEPRGLPVQTNLTRVGDNLYLSIIGRDYRLQAPATQVRRLDTRQLFTSIASWVAAPRADGTEEIDGARTVKVTGTVDTRAIARDLATLLAGVTGVGGVVPTPAQITARAARLQPQLATSEATLWVRTADLRPARARVSVDLPNAGVLATELKSLTLEATVSLSDLDGDLSVSEPTNATPLSAGSLGGLLG